MVNINFLDVKEEVSMIMLRYLIISAVSTLAVMKIMSVNGNGYENWNTDTGLMLGLVFFIWPIALPLISLVVVAHYVKRKDTGLSRLLQKYFK